jgi:uncharacterized protein
LSCVPSVQSKPPLPPEQRSIQPLPDLKPIPQVQKLPLSAQLNVNGRVILLEVARTPEQQSIGLMNRKDLATDRGMLFVFSPPRPVSFWMKNTLIPLDMIFVSNGVVKHVGQQIRPCAGDPCPSYGPEPSTDIDGVIELRGGRAAELQLKVGDRLKISNYSAKRLK